MQILKASASSITALMGLTTSAGFSPTRFGAPPPSGSALHYAVDENHIDQPRAILAPYVVFLDDPFYRAPHPWLGQVQVSLTMSTKFVEGESEAWAGIWAASQDTVPRKTSFLAPEGFDMQVQREVLAARFREQQEQQRMILAPVNQVSVALLSDDSPVDTMQEDVSGTVGAPREERQTEEDFTTSFEFPAPSMEERIAGGFRTIEEMADKQSSEIQQTIKGKSQVTAPVASKIQLPVDPAGEATAEPRRKIADNDAKQLHVSVATAVEQRHPNVPNPVVLGNQRTNSKDAKKGKAPLTKSRAAAITPVSRPPIKRSLNNVLAAEKSTTKNEELRMTESTTSRKEKELSTEISKDTRNNTKGKEITLVEGGLAAMALVGLSTAVGLEVSTLVDVAMLGVAVGAFSSVFGSPKKRDGELMDDDQISLISPSGNQTAVMVD
uniref:Uncharacterized protein n=1 Tax=Amphora coffeiformis TaxID=265554 RepID=A0A7S3P313_9STRA|mmetsp:Transcript_2977/g.5733  ORF Transcript_2977/g.5733 Transcript_2977/m.5733 type:complete len:439 (+) Transcript_2977:68-1384(+)